MEKFRENFGKWNQPQLLSLIVTVLIIFTIALIIFIKIKKHSRPNKAPTKTVLVAENFVSAMDASYVENTNDTLSIARFYIFSLFTFLLVGNMLGLIGLEPIATSYSVTLTLAGITFVGIYLVGLWYQRLRFFLRYIKNPPEIIGQFAPLISLGFRMFGNITAGAVIMYATYFLSGWIWSVIFPGPQMYFFAVVITPWMHMFFDIFGALIQALIFSVLTTIYWSNEVEIRPKKQRKNNQKSMEKENNIITITKDIY
ncbi:ATP synthase A chain [Mycoplasmopsis californica HAZ160_1]|uniref:ATP synthase A chain n=1 Tax=Mycoplasmopsis californica HAZ160_1 TaxID=1397850 RepID=A0AAT9F7U7_9BACT|nr:F0F1 ATP synthase subunit A [Mycoplasmopsis californica]BAP00963.1 ATP synthase A chain [Mycoplasmopsis californica HAZ160_1]BBG40827.1 ATP synthase A chain [Mycoplasmopsis californica]BBG41421.1 ATP synthase A chain [Mycoplasmopsis californica]BBG42014.1 ATP synthase A chain [Mycoplasmopsis californica]BBG42598.1 ATP synthase A chain [Mycoplasmopsis californica]